jgi:hypothetical protein
LTFICWYISANSWHQMANLIYLEAPAFVGFSYSDTASDMVRRCLALFPFPCLHQSICVVSPSINDSTEHQW